MAVAVPPRMRTSLKPSAIVCALTAVAASFATVTACSVDQATTAPPGTVTADGSVSPVGSLPDGGSAPPNTGTDGASPPAPISPSATFSTLDTHQYLSASADGSLTAASNGAGASETFVMTDRNGGALQSGDSVHLARADGRYLSATDATGTLAFTANAPGESETFLIVLVDADGATGGPIAAGDEVALQVKSTGKYVSAINGGGGQVLANAPWDRAWETFTLGLTTGSAGDAGPVPTSDAGVPSANAARKKVLEFLAKISGNHTTIGVENKGGGVDDTNQMTSMAGNGQKPSFWSADWGFAGAASASSREAIVQEGKKQWAAGALVQYIYHVCPLGWGANEQCEYEGGNDPIKGSFGQLDDTQWADLTTAGGTLNKVWLARLDVLAVYFQELKDAGIAPLFRPLHEINGGWAWWQGRPGSKGSALLYQITHDYLVDTKGLDNIVWVWNVQDYDTLATDVNDYRPGAAYYDVAALDVYNTGYTQGNYEAMKVGAAGKPFGIAECQYLPEPSLLTQQPLWAFAVVWPDFFYPPYASNNTKQVPELFADPQVMTLSAMPGW